MSVKISELPILDSLADNDIVAGVDVSGNVTSKIEMSTLKNYIDTNTQYTAGTNIDITDNVISAPNVYNKNEMDDQIEELQSEVDSLSTIFNAFPTESGEGESLTLDDTAEVKFKKFDLKGNTSQTGTPTPSSPIPVNVVSGDNEIQIWGESLVGNDTQQYIVNLKAGDKIKIMNPSPAGNNLDMYTNYGDTTRNDYWGIGANATRTVTVAYDTKAIAWRNQTSATKWVIKLDDIDTYNIDLPVENLFDKSTATTGKGVNVNTGALYNETATFATDYIEIQNNTTYIPSGYSSSVNRVYGAIYDSNKSYLEGISTDIETKKFTISNANAKYIRLTGFVSEIDTWQLELGSKANTYTPYGTTPIELCKIGNYEDKFIRTSGKNLFDVFSNVFLGSSSAKTPTISSDGKITSEANFATARGKGMFVELESNTTYTLSFNIDSIYASTGTARVFIEGKIYNETSPTTDLFTGASYNTTGLKSITFTTPTIPEGQKCGIIFNGGWYTSANVSSTFSNVMIEKSSTVSEYEPYGLNEWYIKKNIGKVVLDGSESSWVENSATKGLFQVTLTNVLNNLNTINALSNLLRGDTGTNVANQTYSESINNTIATFSSNRLFFRINDYRENLAGLKTYLASNNLIAYYVLTTPTTTEITYQPLIDQLNELEKAMSKDGQTNISQVSNDKPFILDVTAIKSLQSVLDRIELLES